MRQDINTMPEGKITTLSISIKTKKKLIKFLSVADKENELKSYDELINGMIDYVCKKEGIQIEASNG